MGSVERDILMQRQMLSTRDLYESVKALVECPAKLIHLNQHKLYTLFSISFQHLLFSSTKEAGHYIIRVENSHLAMKLARKAKDDSTHKFMNNLLVQRRLRYGKSTFHLDFFNVATWGTTKELPKDRVKGALIVRNTTNTPMDDSVSSELLEMMSHLPEDYFLSSLNYVPKRVIISFEQEYPKSTIVRFPFIKEKKGETLTGVKLSSDLNFGLEE